MRVGRYLIYGLVDPRDCSLRYIGKTHKRSENRLADHIERAQQGDKRPVYQWIRELLDLGMEPEIFVWKRIEPNADWREAEKKAIRFWKNPREITFPYFHPPQTQKSKTTRIASVNLANVIHGGQ